MTMTTADALHRLHAKVLSESKAHADAPTSTKGQQLRHYAVKADNMRSLLRHIETLLTEPTPAGVVDAIYEYDNTLYMQRLPFTSTEVEPILEQAEIDDAKLWEERREAIRKAKAIKDEKEWQRMRRIFDERVCDESGIAEHQERYTFLGKFDRRGNGVDNHGRCVFIAGQGL